MLLLEQEVMLELHGGLSIIVLPVVIVVVILVVYSFEDCFKVPDGVRECLFVLGCELPVESTECLLGN